MSLSNCDTTMQVVPAGNGGNSWGGNWESWIILFLIFGMFGWGGFGGFGGAGNAAQGYDTRADVQRGFDQQAVISKLDGLTHGQCDAAYAINNAITSGFSNAELARCNQQAAMMQQLNNMTYQQQDCCCATQRAIDGVKFAMAQEDCATRSAIHDSTRDIVENQNSNARAILDAMTAQRIEAKDQRIAEQQQMIMQLQMAASQAAQNATLMAAMDANTAQIIRRTGNDCPVPAYVVQPPTQVQFPRGCWSYDNGCGCGSCGTCA